MFSVQVCGVHSSTWLYCITHRSLLDRTMKINSRFKLHWILKRGIIFTLAVLALINVLFPILWKFPQTVTEIVWYKRNNSTVENVPKPSDNITDGQLGLITTDPVNEMKVILLWTDFFRWDDYQFGLGQEPFLKAGCRFTNCVTTKNRSLVNHSQAVIFHPNNYKMDDFPSYRRPDQRYIFYFFESLPNFQSLPIFHHLPEGFFNWTMTYRRDSDIYSSQYYGILKRKSTSKVANSLPVLLPSGNVLLTGQNQTNTKTKLITWFSSRCSTPSLREVFFDEMGKYIAIDIYGKCGKLKCLPWNSPECEKVLLDYKFYIAAENTLCTDYITEKFYRALEAGVVPIVYGGADYSAYAPPYSYINAMDFDSPEALANYLKILDSNPRLYSRYLEWKKDWEVIRHPMDGWCDLCEKLNDPDQQSKSYIDINKWWYNDVPCLSGKSLMKRFHLPQH